MTIPRERVVSTYGPILAVLWLAVMMSVVAWYLMALSESRATAQDFSVRAGNQILILQRGIDENLDRMQALRALFESSKRMVTRQEFEIFSASLLRGHEAILNVSWNPLVTRAERAALERAAVDDGIPDYHVRIVGQDGSLPPSPERNEYLPKFYSTEAPTSPVYGLDLLDGAMRQRTVEHARDTDLLAATPPLALHTGMGDRQGFWVGLPVYGFGLPHDTVDSRRRNFHGLVLGVFQIGVMIDSILANIKTPVRLYVFASDAGADEFPLYYGSRSATVPIEAKTQRTLAGEVHQTQSLAIGDTHWTLIVAPEPTALLSKGFESSRIVLVAGLLLSVALMAYMWTTRRYADRLKAANVMISDLARTDALTALANRRAFAERLAQSFAAARRGSGAFAILYFDLDGFKQVNDTLGHPCGDALLQQVATRAKVAVRETDVVARFGGDEFAVLQSHVGGPAGVSTLAAKLVGAIAAPYTVGGHKIFITASIGIALYTAAVENPEALMMDADLALYRAKADGRNCFRIFDEVIDRKDGASGLVAEALQTGNV